MTRKGLLAFTGLTVALTLLAGSVAAFAFAWQGVSGDRIQLRLKDGSCQVADDQDRLRECDPDYLRIRLKDGSCQLAADQLQIQLKQQLKDGSCQDVAYTRTWTRDRYRDRTRTQQLLQDRTRARLRDGSCTA